MGVLVSLGILLIILWLLGWLAFHVTAGAIHILVVVGVVLLVWGLIKRAGTAV